MTPPLNCFKLQIILHQLFFFLLSRHQGNKAPLCTNLRVCERVCVRALTAPAALHPGGDAVGPSFAGGAGRSRGFQRAGLSPLLLQQVRQRPGEQAQSQFKGPRSSITGF